MPSFNHTLPMASGRHSISGNKRKLGIAGNVTGSNARMEPETVCFWEAILTDIDQRPWCNSIFC